MILLYYPLPDLTSTIQLMLATVEPLVLKIQTLINFFITTGQMGTVELLASRVLTLLHFKSMFVQNIAIGNDAMHGALLLEEHAILSIYSSTVFKNNGAGQDGVALAT